MVMMEDPGPQVGRLEEIMEIHRQMGKAQVEVALHQRVAMAGQEAASVVEQKVETR